MTLVTCDRILGIDNKNVDTKIYTKDDHDAIDESIPICTLLF